MAGQHMFFTQEEIGTPKTGQQVLVDHWWPVNEEGKVCLWRLGPRDPHWSPQANRDRKIAEVVGEKTIPGYSGVVQIHTAFVDHHCGE